VDMDATSAAGGASWPGRLARPALAAALLGLVGCLGDSGFANDPLTNGPPMPRNPTASGAPARGATAGGARQPLPAVGGPPKLDQPGGPGRRRPDPRRRGPRPAHRRRHRRDGRLARRGAAASR